MSEQDSELPVPEIDPRPVNVAQYHAWTPEKFELLAGYLFHGPDYPEGRQRLLKLLLVNVGLGETVKLVPAARWREALDRVYGPEG